LCERGGGLCTPGQDRWGREVGKQLAYEPDMATFHSHGHTPVGKEI